MKYIVLIFLALFVGGCDINKDTEQERNLPQNSVENIDYNEYEKAVERLEEISLEEIERKLSNDESFFLYTGRESCPYCRKFVPKLSNVASEIDTKIYYLDSEDMTEGLEEFMMLHEIAFVPSFIYFEDNTNLRINSLDSENISESEIQDFIQYSVE